MIRNQKVDVESILRETVLHPANQKTVAVVNVIIKSFMKPVLGSLSVGCRFNRNIGHVQRFRKWPCDREIGAKNLLMC